MGTTLRWTSADLEVLHNDGKRYEIIDGDLYVSRQPGYHHQYACTQLSSALVVWLRSMRQIHSPHPCCQALPVRS